MGEELAVRANLTQIDTWLFDLDHTLYPASCPLMEMVDERMNAYVARIAGLEPEAASALRHTYFVNHGTTLNGLIIEHGIDPMDFLNDVQDVSVDCVSPDPALRAGLRRLPGRRLVFTNAGQRYATRVLDKLGVADLFEDVFHIEAANFIPKPKPETFDAIVKRHAITPTTTAFFEDLPRNLKPAAAIGMTTVLVGPEALENRDAFVHHRTQSLPAFLATAQIREA
jgi:putative hydrolase of the HAD superfamily